MQSGSKRKAIHLSKSQLKAGSNDYQVLKSFSKKTCKRAYFIRHAEIQKKFSKAKKQTEAKLNKKLIKSLTKMINTDRHKRVLSIKQQRLA